MIAFLGREFDKPEQQRDYFEMLQALYECRQRAADLQKPKLIKKHMDQLTGALEAGEALQVLTTEEKDWIRKKFDEI